ncbi:MAG: hypothetical protein ACLGIW_11990, partial [Gammaproteobacteria bacterium]
VAAPHDERSLRADPLPPAAAQGLLRPLGVVEGPSLDVARAAGEALDLIARSITEINERNLLIASASEEQASVAREVDRNLVNIRDLSLQTSAGANQTSASSQELSRLAVELNSMVSRFRL